MLTLRIDEDMHVHSTFSDGRHTIEENVETALHLGLRRLCCVDHVRRDTAWVPEFTRAVAAARARYRGRIDIYAGVEAKFLNGSGYLDLPDNLEGIDFIYAADHQFPLGDHIYKPGEIREMLATRQVEPGRLCTSLVNAMVSAMLLHNHVILAHPFSILPKVGLTEDHVPEEMLCALALCARFTDTPVEISERWRCPSSRTVQLFRRMRVKLLFSTDAHRKEAIGRYHYGAEVARTAKTSYAPIASFPTHSRSIPWKQC